MAITIESTVLHEAMKTEGRHPRIGIPRTLPRQGLGECPPKTPPRFLSLHLCP